VKVWATAARSAAEIGKGQESLRLAVVGVPCLLKCVDGMEFRGSLISGAKDCWRKEERVERVAEYVREVLLVSFPNQLANNLLEGKNGVVVLLFIISLNPFP
jgi:hypothetical protein